MTDPHRFLLGQIAVEHDLIDQGQLQKCIDIQRSSANPTRLGQVLLDLGFINRHQLKFLEAKQMERMEETDVFQNRPARDVLFGKLVVQRGYCRDDHVNECLRESAVAEAEGQELRLGELLVQKGYLSPYQLNSVLAEQNKRIRFCPTCEKHYNILGYRPGFRLRCLTCESVLIQSPEVHPTEAVEELFFDEERAENIMLLGQVALRNRLLDQEQIDAALTAQEERWPGKTIGEILVELGHLTQDGLQELLRLQEESKQRKKLIAAHRSRETLLGQLAVREGMASDDMVNRVLMVQEREKAERGSARRFGIVMVEFNFLTELQVLALLEKQGRRIARCPTCSTQFNLIAHDSQDVACPRDKALLKVLERTEDLAFAEEILVGEEKLDVLEMDSGEQEIPFADDLRSTRRMFREFYRKEGLGDDAPAETIDLDDEGDDSEQESRRLVPLDVARRERLHARARDEVRRHRWLLPAVGGGVFAAIATVSIVGYLLTGPPERTPDGGPDANAPPPVEQVLREGVTVEAVGFIPAGEIEGVALIEEDIQAFLIVVGEDRVLWAVDRSGASFHRLQYIGQPTNVGIDKPVRAVGIFRAGPPVGLTLPPVEVAGSIDVESWSPIRGGQGNVQRLRVLGPPP